MSNLDSGPIWRSNNTRYKVKLALNQWGPKSVSKNIQKGGGGAAYLLLTQQPRNQLSTIPTIFLMMLLTFIDSTAWNSGQRLDNVN